MKSKKIIFTTPSQINKVLQEYMGYTIIPSTIESGYVAPHEQCKGDCSNLVDFKINGEINLVSCKTEDGNTLVISLAADNYHLNIVEMNDGFFENEKENRKPENLTKVYDGYAVTDLSIPLQEANRKEYGYMYDRFLLANIKREKRSALAHKNAEISEKNKELNDLITTASCVQSEITHLSNEKNVISYKFSEKEGEVLNNL